LGLKYSRITLMTQFAYLIASPLFLLLCMSVVGLIGAKHKWQLVHKRLRWIIAWAAIGFVIASLLAPAAFNTGFAYRNAANLVWPCAWPFRLSLIGKLDDVPLSPPIGFFFIEGLINGGYYAVLAALTSVAVTRFK